MESKEIRNKIDLIFSQLGRHMRAIWCSVGGFPDGNIWSIEDPTNRRDSQCHRLDTYRLFD